MGSHNPSSALAFAQPAQPAPCPAKRAPVDAAPTRALQSGHRMRKRLTRSLGRRLLVAALTAAWVLAPAAPALACALATGDDASMQASMQASKMDCHGGATKRATDETERPVRHPCCSDAETSCCLRSLDVDGAVSTFVTLDMPSIALPMSAPVVTSSAALPAAFVPLLRPDASPPGCPFRVLRL